MKNVFFMYKIALKVRYLQWSKGKQYRTGQFYPNEDVCIDIFSLKCRMTPNFFESITEVMKNILDTHIMQFRCVENFLEASEQKN